MRAFQDEGNKAVFIVGDYTTRIGDPSGRSSERPILSDEEIDANARLYLEQAKVILRDDPELLEVRYNGEWLSKLSYADVVRLGRIVTLARMLERDDFEKRYRAGEPISISELLYPLMQAYDSVAIDADIEIGGTDQLYNLLTGRDVMTHYGLDPQMVITYPLLVGTDGVEKMSKSRGNYIGITEAPEEMFGKTMSIPDAALPQWWEMLVGDDKRPDEPMEWKLELARRIVRRWHGDEAAEEAEAHFTRVVRHREAPPEVEEGPLPDGDPIHLPRLLVDEFGLASTSSSRSLIAHGGVRVDGAPVAELDLPRDRLEGKVLQVGKRRFKRFSAA